jgi:uncharacterized RmlC-like cupin family protein
MAEATERVRLVRADEREPGPPTPGLDRQQAFATDALWAGLVRSEPDMASGWHHHGDHQTIAYVLSGSLRFEFGPGGSEGLVAGPGDFVLVPARLVHRESTPSSDRCDLVIVRAGRGESTVNVDGPEPG